MLARFLDPAVLATISGLDLVAKTVVEGFIAGLHRSPDFGFSQEFAEYRAYTPGDDLRYVDWNVFARTERCYLKRYRGETNTALTVLLDASASMGFGSHRVNKLDYARYLAASLFYLATRQRDAAGLIVFDDEVRDVVAPSSRHGQLSRLLHALERAAAGRRTDYARPFLHLLDHLRRRGIVVVISDFYAPAAEIVRTMAPVRFRGSELVLFHVLDPEELRPEFAQPVLLVDAETGQRMEVAPEYARREYRSRIEAHVAELCGRATEAGMDYFLIETARPLDAALREYLSVREGRM
ncbi:MAG: DUF58 domain-containing protein [Bryobacterales bacterium]|nr:DUF58 domain-containing protein [Bryobacteraceae bacterium]MDW8129770.1 DUF58 domain-containing protein [Bryobacterales bacterium]